MGELELGLRQRAIRFLEGNLSLTELYNWLAAEAWNIDARADAGVAQLYHDVELLLAEHARGDWTEDELKDRLAPFAAYFALIPGQVSVQAIPGNIGRRTLRLSPTTPTRIRSIRSLTPALAS